jgi:hypothetical protein
MRALLYTGCFYLHASVEGIVNHTASLNVSQLRAHKSGTLTGLHVLKLSNDVQLVVVIQDEAVAEVCGSGH